MVAVSSWGRLSADEHDLQHLTERAQIFTQITDSSKKNMRGIAYGMGRSYGDVCLNPNGILWKTTALDRFISFNAQTGLLICEAGVLLRDIQRFAIPRGWMLPVTPGTQLITVGGGIANDVHGKNHHVFGTFGEHVQQLTLQRTDGEMIECGPHLKSDYFSATVGGVGLTGVILTAALQLRPMASPWLETEIIPYSGIDDFFQLADASEAQWEHTVSWVDCTKNGAGRGLFMRANPIGQIEKAIPKIRPWTMPVTPPISLVNRWSLPPFNMLYFQLKKQQVGRVIAHYESFFYPLDNLLHWNRMYGPKGFFQYQCVVPRNNGLVAIQAILHEIAISKQGSFLTVLKTFGDRPSVGMLSFPQPGVTLALDFPNQGDQTCRLFKKMDSIVQEAGGRIYLAKDARMPRHLFEAGYPKLGDFLRYRDAGMSSALSRRLID